MPRLLGVKVREAEFAVTCARVNAELLDRLAGTTPGERVVVNYHGDEPRALQTAAATGRGGGDADPRDLRPAGAVQGAPHSAARRRRARPPGALSS